MIFLELFWTFFKIGAVTFGGGYAMLPLIQEEVLAKGWIEEKLFVDLIAVSESSPGPFAVNSATYIGSEVGGVFGSFCATMGVVLPSFIVILIVAKCLERFQKSKAVKGILSGLKPAVVGLIAAAILSIGKTVLFPQGVSAAVFTDVSLYVSLGIFALGAVLAFRKVHPILIICISAALGVIYGFLPLS